MVLGRCAVPFLCAFEIVVRSWFCVFLDRCSIRNFVCLVDRCRSIFCVFSGHVLIS